MNMKDFTKDKYILFKNTKEGLKFWKDHAVGYTQSFMEAGVYTKEQVEALGVRKLTIGDVRKNNYSKFIHFALTLEEAIIGLR